jgi:CO/xanthine dehydrogenase FAD-binding subunit
LVNHDEVLMRWEAYYLPETVEEALELLVRYAGRARVVGGGTDYFVDDPGPQAHSALVDVTQIRTARDIQQNDGFVVIGCGVTHTQIVQSALVQQRGAALAEACGQIGGPQVRNVATLAGNIAHALPAADGTVALLALGGEVLVASRLETTPSVQYGWLPLLQVFKGPGVSSIDSTRQILVAMRFRPTRDSEGSAFARVMRPQGVALPIMGLAVRVKVREGRYTEANIAVGPVAPTPFRPVRTAACLIGKQPGEQTTASAIDVLLTECQPRTSAHRATAEYRRDVLPVLFRQALERAVERNLAESRSISS